MEDRTTEYRCVLSWTRFGGHDFKPGEVPGAGAPSEPERGSRRFGRLAGYSDLANSSYKYVIVSMPR